MDDAALEQLKSQVDDVVDNWVSTVLKDRFISMPIGQKPRSLWDRFKQGVANWWWGPKGEKYNRYRWRNRFGDELGVEESFDPSIFTLHDYKDMRAVVDSVESRLVESAENFDKLRLMTLIQSAAKELKVMLFDAIKNFVTTRSSAPSGATPPSEPAPSRATLQSGATPEKITRPSKEDTGVTSQKKSSSDMPPKKPSEKAAVSKKKNVKVKPVASSREEEKGEFLDSSTKKSEIEPDKDGRASEDESSAGQVGDESLLQRYFFTEKGEPLDFSHRISSFLKSDKYRVHEDLKTWWKSELEKAKGKDESEVRADWYVRLVSENDFLNSISKATGKPKDEVRRDMVAHLKNLEQQG